MRLFVLGCSLFTFAAGWIVQSPAAQSRRPEPTAFEPITFFNKKCVYCHAKDGAAFTPEVLAKYTEKTMEDRLLEMTDEKAKAPLADRELDVMLAWFRAMKTSEPFIVWTALRDGVYKFEASPGSTLTASEGTVTKDGTLWRVTGVTKPESLVLTAKVGRKQTVLRIAQSSVSHPCPR
jgi:hypothetical protein